MRMSPLMNQHELPQKASINGYRKDSGDEVRLSPHGLHSLLHFYPQIF